MSPFEKAINVYFRFDFRDVPMATQLNANVVFDNPNVFLTVSTANVCTLGVLRTERTQVENVSVTCDLLLTSSVFPANRINSLLFKIKWLSFTLFFILTNVQMTL